MSVAEITEGRLTLTAAQSRCHFNTNRSNNCIHITTPALETYACSPFQISKTKNIYSTKKYSTMSADNGEVVADATWDILWGLSSCAFLFPSERRAAKDVQISLIPTKDLCHMIYTSQSLHGDGKHRFICLMFHSCWEKLFICLFLHFILRGYSALFN